MPPYLRSLISLLCNSSYSDFVRQYSACILSVPGGFWLHGRTTVRELKRFALLPAYKIAQKPKQTLATKASLITLCVLVFAVLLCKCEYLFRLQILASVLSPRQVDRP